MKSLFMMFLVAMLFCASISAQTTAFSFQGSLKSSGLPANGNFDFEFSLWNEVVNGTQQGTTQTVMGVAVADGIFTVNLDFGAGTLPGADRFLDIAVRTSGGGAFTALTPRQKVNSSPYSIKSLNSTNADVAANATQLGGVAANQYVVTTDPRMTDARNPLPNSANYIWNQNSVLQPSSNFIISGNGFVGGTLEANIVTATTQYNIGGNRVFGIAGLFNTFAGNGTGTANTLNGVSNSFFGYFAGNSNIDGDNNSFFGRSAGQSNTSGTSNSFFGHAAGDENVTGSNNAFFGTSAGTSNTASDNSFFGYVAGSSNTTGSLNAFFGANAGDANTDGNSNSFFGMSAGRANVGGDDNSFFGTAAGFSNTQGNSNSFFGRNAGQSNIGGNFNSFFGENAGRLNTSGSSNAFFGSRAGFSNDGGTVNAFFGVNAGESNTGGSGNAFFGANAGVSNLTGSENSFFGNNAGTSNIGNQNSFFGYEAGSSNTSGIRNAFFGNSAGLANTNGFSNVFVGTDSGMLNTDGFANVFVGGGSGNGNTGGSSNAFFGTAAGAANTIGTHNTIIGDNANVGSGSLTFATAIGSFATVSISNSIVLGRSADTVRVPGTLSVTGGTDVEPGSGGYLVAGSTASTNVTIDDNEIMARSNGATNTLFLNADGGDVNLISTGTGNVGIGIATTAQDKLHVDGIIRVTTLGGAGGTSLCRNASLQISTCSSSLRYKTNINPFSNGLAFVNRLQPISFDWKDGGMKDVGFGAEDIAKIDPRFVTYNDKGQVEGVKYDRIGVVLVNAVKEQQTQIERQQTLIDELWEKDVESQNKVKAQQRLLDRQQDELKKQRSEIDALKALMCLDKPAAGICKEN